MKITAGATEDSIRYFERYVVVRLCRVMLVFLVIASMALVVFGASLFSLVGPKLGIISAFVAVFAFTISLGIVPTLLVLSQLGRSFESSKELSQIFVPN